MIALSVDDGKLFALRSSLNLRWVVIKIKFKEKNNIDVLLYFYHTSFLIFFATNQKTGNCKIVSIDILPRLG